jgi:hypothetical protein
MAHHEKGDMALIESTWELSLLGAKMNRRGSMLSLLMASILALTGCNNPIEDCGNSPNASRMLMEGPLSIPGEYNALKLNIQATEIRNGKI